MRGGSGQLKRPAVAEGSAELSLLGLVGQLSAISASIVSERCHKTICPFISRYGFIRWSFLSKCQYNSIYIYK